MYGRKYLGVVRTTYLIGPDGKVLRRWDKVSVPGHAAEVLAAIGGSPVEPDRKVAPKATKKATKKVAKKVAGKPAAKPTRRARG
jgi:peroxiredoxin Q/BCP